MTLRNILPSEYFSDITVFFRRATKDDLFVSLFTVFQFYQMFLLNMMCMLNEDSKDQTCMAIYVSVCDYTIIGIGYITWVMTYRLVFNVQSTVKFISGLNKTDQITGKSGLLFITHIILCLKRSGKK